MAEKDKDIDALFRAGLANHSETPSPKSWKQLQGKLSEQKNGRIVFWRRIAATLLLLAGATSIWWYSVRMTDNEIKTLAEEYIQGEPGSSVSQKNEADVPSSSEENRMLRDTVQDTLLNPVNKEQTQPIRRSVSIPVRETVAVNDQDVVPARVMEKAPAITKLGSSGPELPEMDFSPRINRTIHQEQEGEVAYTVTIISNGITEKPVRDNLVKEIEDKIDKLGGVVYRMDQGFADLQDAKNGLFASLTSKDGNKKSK